jgi:thiamine transport system permease protein
VLFWALGAGTSERAWASVATDPYYRARILFTFGQAAASTVLTLALGIPLAYVFATRSFRLKPLLRSALTVPFVMPPLVVALALDALIGRDSLLAAFTTSSPLAALGPVGAILLAHLVYNLSVVLRLVAAAWERVPPSLLDAARTLGATSRRAAVSLLLPIAAPTIAAAAVLVFLFSASSFGIILLLGGPTVGTVETLIFDEVASFRPHYDTAAVLGLIQLATTLAAVALYAYLQRHGRARYTPHVHAPTRAPSNVHRLLVGGAVLLVVGPFLALFIEAFRFQGNWSLAPWRALFRSETPLGPYSALDAIQNSVGFAAVTLLVAVPLAWASLHGLRRVAPGTAWHSVLLVPLGTSTVLLGLGMLLVYDGRVLIDLRASPARILFAHVLIAYPFVTRILAAAFDSLNPAIVQAARTLGARTHHLFLRLELPLLRPAVVAAAVFAFAISLGEFGATLVLRRPEFTTLPLAIFDAYGRPGESFRAQAEILALLLALVALASFWVLERNQDRSGKEFL